MRCFQGVDGSLFWHGFWLLSDFWATAMARDVSQEAFIRVIKSADSFRGDSSFRTFVRVGTARCIGCSQRPAGDCG